MRIIFLLALLYSAPSFAQLNFWSGSVNKCSTVRNTCLAHYEAGCRTSGEFKVLINNVITKVQCEQKLAGGGWMVVQSRDANTDFYRNWVAYRDGFTNNSTNFWLGLERMYQYTKNAPRTLGFYLEKSDGTKGVAMYSNFQLGNEANFYKMSSPLAYSYHNAPGFIDPGNSFNVDGSKFSTPDKDNDVYSGNCATEFYGAWWYTQCHSTNLNARYTCSASNPTCADFTNPAAQAASWHGMFVPGTTTQNGYVYANYYFYALKNIKIMIR